MGIKSTDNNAVKQEKGLKKKQNSLKEYFEMVKHKREIKNTKVDSILPLSPKLLNAEHIDEYLKRIHATVKSDDLYNISITGNYGTGKSSIIKTYIKKFIKKKNKYVVINIASYFDFEETKSSSYDKESTDESKNQDVAIKEKTKDEEQSENNNNGNNRKLEKSEIELVDQIEAAILRQLLFRNSSDSMRESDIKRVSKIGKRKFNVFTIFYLICSLVFMVSNNLYDINKVFLNYIDKISISSIVASFINSIATKIEPFINCISYIIIFISVPLFIISLINVMYLITTILFYGTKSLKFKVNSNEISFTDKDELAFSKNLREIILFFANNKKCKLVVFEDIDRFSKDVTLKLVEELKQLNNIINHSDAVSQKVTFIYSFKDNIFSKVEDKSKFYDYNISVMPISSYYNSSNILDELLSASKITNSPGEIIKAILTDHITDVRTLITIINDYELFCNILKIDNTNKNDKVFAMTIFKNIYFEEYEKILEHNNFIDQRFETIKFKREALIADIDKENRSLENKIKNIKDESISDIVELKQLFWFNCVTQNGDRNSSTLYSRAENKYYNYNTFINNDFDISRLEKEEFELNWGAIDYSHFGGKEDFLKKIQNVNKDKIKEYQNKIFENNEKIETFKIMSDAKIYNEYIKVYKSEDLLDELIANGYIERNYIDYITSPSSSGLTGSENKFIFEVKHKEYNFELPITNPSKVTKQLERYFKVPYILNIDILKHVQNDSRFNIIAKQFAILDESKLEFLDLLKLEDKYLFTKLINTILTSNIDLWKLVNEENINSNYKEMIFEAIMCSRGGLRHINDKANFIQYTNDYFNSKELESKLHLLRNNNCHHNISSYMKHKIRINNITEIPVPEKEFIIKQGLYKYNYINIKDILGFVPEDLDLRSIKILDEGRLFLTSIEENFQTFYEEYYSTHKIKINDVSRIKKILASKLSLSAKKTIYERENFQLPFDSIDKELYEQAVKLNHIIPSWDSIFHLTDKMKKSVIYDYILKNKEKLLSKETLEKEFKVFEKNILFIAELLIYLLNMKDESLAKNINDCILSKFNHKYYAISGYSDPAVKILCEWDLLSYKIPTLKRLYILEPKLATLYLNNWYNYTKYYREIYLKIRDNKKYVSMLLKVKNLSNEERIEIIIKEKTSTEKTKELLNVAFQSNEQITINYKKSYEKSLFNNENYSSLFKSCDITSESITFSI